MTHATDDDWGFEQAREEEAAERKASKQRCECNSGSSEPCRKCQEEGELEYDGGEDG